MANKPASRSRNSVVAGGYSVLFVGFLLAIALPYLHNVRTAQADIDRSRSLIATRQNQGKQLQEIAGTIKEITAETQDYARLVPPNQDLGSFLQELDKQLDESGMTDISHHNLPPTPLGRSEKLPIEVKGKGTFEQFHEFLLRLEKLPRLASVGRLSIDAETDMNGHVDIELTLYIYNAKPTSN